MKWMGGSTKRESGRTLGGDPLGLAARFWGRQWGREAVVCRGAWARVAMDQFRHLALQTIKEHRASANILADASTGFTLYMVTIIEIYSVKAALNPVMAAWKHASDTPVVFILSSSPSSSHACTNKGGAAVNI
jgi:hypothetical protein